MTDGPWAGRKLHFVGIGGAGMSGLALVARALGADVTGSDRADSSYCERLREHGVEPVIGHAAENVPEGAEVVVSTAIAGDNPETAGRDTLHRADLLAQAAELKRCIAIAGAHGKTTTASMAAHILLDAGTDPAYLIGGELTTTRSNAGWGAGDWIVVEADESDRSFLKIEPEVAVVTNIELDHHATYHSARELDRAFEQWVEPAQVRIYHEEVALPGAAQTYGQGAGADLRAESVEQLAFGSRFEAGGVFFELAVPGTHNVLNALAASLACRHAGVPLQEAAFALRSFKGAGRRFEAHGRTAGGALVYDDYAHHPTEVRATLEAARGAGARRVVACFQPHLYSRTRQLAREFGKALALADEVVVTDIYPARERAEDFPGTTGYLVAQAAASAAHGRPVFWLPSLTQATTLLAERLGEGDLLLTLGAGDVDRVARELTA